MIDRLKDLSVIEKKQKELPNVAIQKTYYFKICINIKIKKKYLNIEQELNAC